MFRDRKHAGQLLAKKLSEYRKIQNTLILGIPRGGIVVAYEVSKLTQLPLDVVVIKKIGTPMYKELAAGATGIDSYILNEEIVKAYDVPEEYIIEQVKLKQLQVKERCEFLRGDRAFYSVENKTVIVIDDGLATGATMIMAIRIIKKGSPKEVICAVPVAPNNTILRLQTIADQIVCLDQPAYFRAIGEFYDDFTQVEDEEVKLLLEQAVNQQ